MRNIAQKQIMMRVRVDAKLHDKIRKLVFQKRTTFQKFGLHALTEHVERESDRKAAKTEQAA